jgi:hypothetical protein
MLHLIAQLSCLWSANDTKHCILVIKTELQVFEVDFMHQLLYPFTCHSTYKPSTVTLFCFICKVWKDPKKFTSTCKMALILLCQLLYISMQATSELHRRLVYVRLSPKTTGSFVLVLELAKPQLATQCCSNRMCSSTWKPCTKNSELPGVPRM